MVKIKINLANIQLFYLITKIGNYNMLFLYKLRLLEQIT